MEQIRRLSAYEVMATPAQAAGRARPSVSRHVTFLAFNALDDMAVRNPAPDALASREPTGTYRIFEDAR